MMIVQPVIIDPLWREWEAVKASMAKPRTSEKRRREMFAGFLERLRPFRVLDPACGSGNFLYLALLALKDLEHRVNLEAEAMGFGRQFPSASPQAVGHRDQSLCRRAGAHHGLDRRDSMDAEKRLRRRAQAHLEALNQIECRDALVTEDGSEAVWPDADGTIGNPPFIGDKKMIGLLGEAYAGQVRRAYAGRVPGGADFVTYWFEKALRRINEGTQERAGFVATQSIRRGASSDVLKRIVGGRPHLRCLGRRRVDRRRCRCARVARLLRRKERGNSRA